MPAKKTGKKTPASPRRGHRAAGKRRTGRPRAPRPQPARAAEAAGDDAILVVNMIPQSLSGETNQDSEPTIAVNPANPLEIVGTAFTPDPMGGSMAPVFISTDGGNTWALNFIVPSQEITGDITVAFGTSGNRLYAGILRFPAPPGQTLLNILRTNDFQSATAMKVLANRLGVDQPFVQAATVAAGNAVGKDRVYVGGNDFAANNGQTTTIDQCLSAAVASPSFKSVRLDPRPTAGQNGPQSRPAIHPDGTVYAAYYGWRSRSGDWEANTLVVTADVVVVRDDQWGAGTKPFTNLVDPDDHLAGLRVARGVTFPFHNTGRGVPGQQRLGGDIAIAVDPTNSNTVYVAWAQQEPPSSVYSFHVRRSTNRGATWSADLISPPMPNAINAALAVNSDGTVGLLYQQLTGDGNGPRWVTHFQRSSDATNWTDSVLSTAPADTPSVEPPTGFDPYLGDYDHLMAVGKDFYGVFSANNTPDLDNFPNGVKYQRNHDFTARTLLALDGTTQVTVSIDPFFFRVRG
jgi:hypothetical protein